MTVSTVEALAPNADSVTVTDDALTAELSDGRTISVPLDWFPRLVHGTPLERSNWRLIGGGQGIHWPNLDEDISIEGLLAGRKSGESQASFGRWIEAKIEGRDLTRGERAVRSGASMPGIKAKSEGSSLALSLLRNKASPRRLPTSGRRRRTRRGNPLRSKASSRRPQPNDKRHPRIDT